MNIYAFIFFIHIDTGANNIYIGTCNVDMLPARIRTILLALHGC